jgi:hypothetical protein
MDAYQTTISSLQIPGGSLFSETTNLTGQRSGGDSGFSYVWPAATQFRTYDALLAIDPVTYSPIVRQFSDQLFSNYWSPSGGYRSGVSSGATRFYDDNAHLAVALAQAYQITRDPIYLSRAQQTYNFVLTGEDLVGGGGTYFSESDHSFKDSAGTLQGARAALLLYQITAQPQYLNDATRLYGWAQRTTQQPDGLFMEKLYLTGPKAGTVGDFTLVNFAGFGIEDNINFYDVTGNLSYLQEAQRIALRSTTRYFNGSTGAINDEGFWSFELVHALDDLAIRDHNPLWINDVDRALLWLHDNRRDPNGHYGTLWGRGALQSSPLNSWNLNDQASVAASFLYTSSVPEPSSMIQAAGALVGLLAYVLCRSRLCRNFALDRPLRRLRLKLRQLDFARTSTARG